MAEEIRITKITLHKGTDLEIHYELPSLAGGIDHMAIRSHDAADPKLYTRLQDMRVHICKLLELEKDYAQRMRVTKVELDWTPQKGADPKDKIEPKVVFTAEKTVPGLDAFKLKTPATRYAGPAAMNIEDLCTLAIRFIHGEREQTELEFDDNQEEMWPTADKQKPKRPARNNSKVVGNIQPPAIGVH